MSESPLAGRCVLLTRPALRGRRLATRLERLGAQVDLRPTIAFEAPSDPRPALQAVSRLDRFDWILFTSPTGVQFFCEALGRGRGQQRPSGLRVGAIGPATAQALEAAGWGPDLVAVDSRSEGLAAEIATRLVAGDRVLIVRPEVARSMLPRQLDDRGACPVPVAFYRTVPAPDVVSIARDVRAARYDAVVFTSPSTLQHLAGADAARAPELLEALRRGATVAIGPVTAGVMRSAGVEPTAVALDPGADALITAICDALAGSDLTI